MLASHTTIGLLKLWLMKPVKKADSGFKEQNTYREPNQSHVIVMVKVIEEREPSPLYGFRYPEEMYLKYKVIIKI